MPVPGTQVASSAVQISAYIAHVVFFHCPNVSVPSVISKTFHGVNGAVFLVSKSHGAVRCSFILLGIVRCSVVRFHIFKVIRCGAVRFFSLTVRCGTDYVFEESHGVVRCDALCIRLTVVFYGAVEHAA